MLCSRHCAKRLSWIITRCSTPPKRLTDNKVAIFVPTWLFPHLPQEANYPSCSLCSIQEPAQNPLKEPQFLLGSVSDFIVLHFCSASQSQRTCLVKNSNQIGESQQCSSPPPLGSAPLPPGQGHCKSWGATTKPFPEPISCRTVCYTLNNVPKIILTSKPALILTPLPRFSPSLCRKAHLQE